MPLRGPQRYLKWTLVKHDFWDHNRDGEKTVDLGCCMFFLRGEYAYMFDLVQPLSLITIGIEERTIQSRSLKRVLILGLAKSQPLQL